MSTVSETC